jgi:hypothetical protein
METLSTSRTLEFRNRNEKETCSSNGNERLTKELKKGMAYDQAGNLWGEMIKQYH